MKLSGFMETLVAEWSYATAASISVTRGCSVLTRRSSRIRPPNALVAVFTLDNGYGK